MERRLNRRIPHLDKMQQIKKRRLEDKIGSDESIIAASTQYKGTISGIESVRIAGQVDGNVKSDRLVWIQREGHITGDIDSRHVIIEGKLIGNITGAEHVEIRVEGQATGNIQTQKIAMAEGSFFKGEIHMPREVDKPTHFVEKRQT
jgi:cytoskeletal protein CcmA (bactofilin family)